ncbi:MAG TPA: hypothetical protein PLM53_02895 [Spirochaetota bacterium]|nr:hypothetical protein [Spirochaetota bacterium]HPC42437.1 hypothetical protein [Spirochaetota bacterium]HPL18459.1 hypothetical protein [Spirochaetota bacterium]HQF06576.1 hypothetical protein [Spirochaetota bacterium]HQH96021.1 hypothetical protein [Spirochaetota bacterium]
MKNIVLIITFMAVLSGPAAAAEEVNPAQQEQAQPAGRKPYKGSASIMGGITMAGVQGEYTFVPHVGIRAVGLAIFGAGFNSMNRDEYILSAIVTPVLHLGPELKILDTVLMLGLVYSYHHWESKASHPGVGGSRTVREGNLHDVTFGAGIGFLFKFADRFKVGINLWLNYDYGVVSTYTMRKKKGNRIILPVPLIEFTVQF